MQNEWTNGNCNRDTVATHCDKVTGGHIPESVSSISYSLFFVFFSVALTVRIFLNKDEFFFNLLGKLIRSLLHVHMVMNRRIAH